MIDDIADRVVVIVGAGAGVGRALALALARRGVKLVLADANPDTLADTVDATQAAGAEVLAMVCDVRRHAHVEELAEAALIRFHGVHALVNGAAAGPDAVAVAIRDGQGAVWECEDAAWDRALGAGVQGALNALRAFTPLMLACARRDPRYRGQIVHLVPSSSDAPSTVRAQAVQALCDKADADLRRLGAPLGVSVLRREAGAAPDAMAAQLFAHLIAQLAANGGG